MLIRLNKNVRMIDGLILLISVCYNKGKTGISVNAKIST